jgi:hypothetical protein
MADTMGSDKLGYSIDLRIGVVVACGFECGNRFPILTRRTGATGDARGAATCAMLAGVLMAAEVDDNFRKFRVLLLAHASAFELGTNCEQALDLFRAKVQRLATPCYCCWAICVAA